MKKVISILLIALCVGCSPHNDNDIDSTQEENYMLIDLSKSDWLIGKWLVMEKLEYSYWYEKDVWKYIYEDFYYTFNSDGTMIGIIPGTPDISGTYTYDNGTLVLTYIDRDVEKTKTFKFYKHSKYRIKLVVFNEYPWSDDTYLIIQSSRLHPNNEQ